ncbi:nicotinate-nucleotide adenylyltransferase [Paraferrimonas sedimenticola]|uniref:Probable nicotinate-nucleotide adenylyltransferase n=1 Tax=Paraferrimonas sedimenticola TaxID=375674 RepID=A0AA37S0A3_9GAMM|nr:nicotinate-nucleotide adenylyltransferase [Paraferrimonas sedimenticola]GLP98012.1 putative nicotinate-nucleotide adenylyltransferase [Paraferrimonas sedimenticola]
MSALRIGLLGGTFDPVHLGHIHIAKQVSRAAQLDEVWLLPNKVPPHKPVPIATSEQRLRMLELALEQQTRLSICDIELSLPSPSYTVNTLEALSQTHPEHEFHFIIGMDSVLSLPSWCRWQDVVKFAKIIGCARPGWHDPIPAEIQHLVDNQVVQIVDIDPIEMSSSQVRKMLANGDNTCQQLSPTVANYIKQHQLYRNPA